jgi:hypothetical protein
MDVQDIAQLLAHADQPLQLMRLAALEPRLQPYLAVLCQPNGIIHACPARIGNANPSGVHPMYASFLEDAIKLQAQLVITPEYSVPWSVIRDIAFSKASLGPPQGSLWILGCESITPGELETFRSELASAPTLRLFHEEFDPQRRAQKVYVDPVVLIFWAVENTGNAVLCLLVQFKTVPSRDPDHVELKSLYLGTTVYRFKAHDAGVSLLTLICSDAFEFTDDLVDKHSNNLLLVHIQLNQKPAYVDYSAYRARLLSRASNNNVEVICLNWAANVLIEGQAKPWNAIAGSAWYVAPRGVTLKDADVNELHRDGLYYSIVGDRWHGFYLNYAAHSLVLSKQPVYFVGAQVLNARIPPQVNARRVWEATIGAWQDATADDGFGIFIETYSPLAEILAKPCQNDPLAIERALELLEGPSGHVDNWYHLKELSVLRVAEEESLRRVTVSQEVDPARQGVQFRRHRARLAQTAATIPSLSVAWPARVGDLANGFRYKWTSTTPHNNVEPTGGGEAAALVYLGDDPESDTLANICAKLTKARQKHAVTVAIDSGGDPSDALILAKDRLCLAYKTNHKITFYKPDGFSSITDAATSKPDDIAGEHS